MSQTNALNLREAKEVKMGLNSFGNKIPEVFEWSECVTDQCFESGKVKGVKLGLTRLAPVS